MTFWTEPTPKNLALSSLPTSCFIFDAATIFMALNYLSIYFSDFFNRLYGFHSDFNLFQILSGKAELNITE